MRQEEHEQTEGARRELIAALVPDLSSPDRETRKAAAQSMVSAWHGDMLPHLCDALDSDDGWLRQGIWGGLCALADTDRSELPEPGRSRFFEAVRDHIGHFGSLALIDRARTIEWIEAESMLNVGHPHFSSALHVMASGPGIWPERARPLMRELLRDGIVQGQASTVARWLGHCRMPEDLITFKEMTSDPALWMVGVIGWRAHAGQPSLVTLLERSIRGPFIDPVARDRAGSTAEMEIKAVLEFDFFADRLYRIDQYYESDRGHQWAMAVAGLERIGAPKMAEVVRSSALLFSPGGPPLEQAARTERIEELSLNTESPFEMLQERYFWQRANIIMLIELEALRHPERYPVLNSPG